MPEQPWLRTTAEHLVHDNAWVQVHDDEVVSGSGRRSTHLSIRSRAPGDGVVLLVRRGERFALVLTYRYPLRAWRWELPRGHAQTGDPAQDVAAELAEELGARPLRSRLLGRTTPDSGLLAMTVQVHLVDVEDDGAEPSEPTDTEEVHGVRWLTWPELLEAVADGRVQDGFTLAAIALLTAAGPR